MFEIAVIVICMLTLILLKSFFNINFKEIKKLEKRESNKLEELSNKFPSDEQVCKEILNKLKNEEVNLKFEQEYTSCLYTIFNNTITLGKFKQNYIKLQTIAHECVHSCQNKKTLWSNFIFTNIYLIYFVIISIFGILNKLSYENIHILILIFFSLIQYIIRYSLESEAMIKARYIAKEYIEENKILTNEEEKLLNEYDEINNIGIPFINFYSISVNLLKVIIFSIIVLI